MDNEKQTAAPADEGYEPANSQPSDPRYAAVLAAIVEANKKGSETGGHGHELTAHVFLAALDAALGDGADDSSGGAQ